MPKIRGRIDIEQANAFVDSYFAGRQSGHEVVEWAVDPIARVSSLKKRRTPIERTQPLTSTTGIDRHPCVDDVSLRVISLRKQSRQCVADEGHVHGHHPNEVGGAVRNGSGNRGSRAAEAVASDLDDGGIRVHTGDCRDAAFEQRFTAAEAGTCFVLTEARRGASGQDEPIGQAG